MTTITVIRPQAVAAPRAAAWAARLFLRLWNAVEAMAETRTARRQARSRAEEAASVRAYALEMEAIDPRYAADLRAAADRHDLGQ
jgi:hypothetical protein